MKNQVKYGRNSTLINMEIDRLRTVGFPIKPTKPKAPRTPLELFYDREKVRVREEFPRYKYNEVKAEVSRRWRSLIDKSEYVRLSRLDRERYDEEAKMVSVYRPRSAMSIFRDDTINEVMTAFPDLSEREADDHITRLWLRARQQVRDEYTRRETEEKTIFTERRVDNATEGARRERARRETTLRIMNISTQLDDAIRNIPDRPPFGVDEPNPFGGLAGDFVWMVPIPAVYRPPAPAPEPVVRRPIPVRPAPANPAPAKPRPSVPPHMVAVFMQARPEDRECPICKETIENDMYLTPCYHLFHASCMKTCDKCPMCREKI
jgi:hypothetical protein